MSPAAAHPLALWRAYDQAVITDRQASAAASAASKTWHPPRSRRRALPPEAAVSRAAAIDAAAAKAAARDAFFAAGLVFDESPNESAAGPWGPAEPPPLEPLGTREGVLFRPFGGDATTPKS